jgi:hypothetical protein
MGKGMEKNLLSREWFRDLVFERDGYKCVICGEPARLDFATEWVTNLDPHHLIERRLWTAKQEFGGYFLDNGATLCETHHRLAEQTVLSVEEIREAAGIKRIKLPEHLYNDNDYTYTKWGDIIMPTGMRVRGELFHDESVQKILASAPGILDLYSKYVKYPRTYHCPWSEKMGKDDKRLPNMDTFVGKRVIVTEKMDGEATTLYNNYKHARSIDSGPHVTRQAVSALWGRISHEIPDEWRICGENLWEKHTIGYSDLVSYFMVYSIWDERNYALSWDETVAYAQMLGLVTVPVLYDGIYDEAAIKALKPLVAGREGYVIRLADEFPYHQFRNSVTKFVQGEFVIVHGRTTRRVITPNGLRPGATY